MYQYFLKRVFDVLSSGLALIFLSPILLYIACLVKKRLGSPVLFTQVRPGKDNKLFKMYKFRSMTDERDSNGKLLPDDERLTAFGKRLRESSLDELPELINIFKGDMSVVGPRPQLVRDMVFFSDAEMQRQSVLPGLTGLAQINGRNNISWEDKFKYDLQYIKNISFFEDMRIIYRTVFKVARQDDINTDGMETAEDYGDYLLRTGKIKPYVYAKKQSIANKLLEQYCEISRR
ncbi:sugar transferase [Veillonellaceae bacterium WCA-693-APC-5D-A]|uniref:Sugar transferase n=1 Tax=Anaerovibrio slackiae TaxID=2652309 RepID=A0A6I2ULJ7_9FIRM|nr:sugar transferase [Anaerovibrio slackiae]MSU09616.1 sugar transferase [Anaerovibrio slackiae]